MLTFVYPWLALLLPLPWLFRYFVPAKQKRQVAIQVPFGARIREATAGDGPDQQQATHLQNLWVPALIWLLVLGALTRPQWIKPPITKTLPTRDLLLLVDLSSSMQKEDFKNRAGQQVNRLSAVKEVLGEFLERRKGDRVGLVVFGDAPYLQTPFTTDLSLARRLLDECDIGMAGPRTALGDAIGLGVNLFQSSHAPAKTIIALTDGNDTKSQVPPVEAARVAAQRGIRIHTVAIGDPTTVGEDKLDEQALRDVAAVAHGSYFFAADRQSLNHIYDELDQIETQKVKTVSHRPRQDLYYWLLAIALLIALSEKLYAALRYQKPTARLDRRQHIRVDALTGELEVT